MTTPMIEMLSWDSTQLKIPTARINANLSELTEALSEAKSNGARLVYWCTENTSQHLDTAQNYNGLLVDRKTTYTLSLKGISLDSFCLSSKPEFYQPLIVTPDLLYLAYESGKFSRFQKDPNLTQQQFEAVYAEWIKNSVNHTIAKEICIVTENASLLGMATVGEKNHRGDIGLLAVHPNARGKKVGTTLVHSALHYFKTHGYDTAQVVTQQDNIPACKLYEKCGFHVEKIELFFHFWL